MRTLSLLCGAALWLSALLLERSVAFTVLNRPTTRGTPLSPLKRKNAPTVATAAVPSALSSPLFGRVQQERRVLRRPLDVKSMNIWKWIRHFAAVLSLVVILRGGVLPPAALAARGGDTVATPQSRVVPAIGVVAAASGAGVFLGKKFESTRSADEEEKAEEEEEEEEQVIVAEEEEPEPVEAVEVEEPMKAPAVKKQSPTEVAKEAERFRAQQLVEKTLMEVKEAERRALERTKPKDNGKSESITDIDDSELPAPKAEIDPPEPETVSDNEESELPSVEDKESKASHSFMPATEEISPPKAEIAPPEAEMVATPAVALTKIEAPVEVKATEKAPKVSTVPVAASNGLLQKAGNVLRQSTPPTKEAAQARYDSIPSVDEKAFSILVDLGMVELTPNPDEPSYDRSRDSATAESRSKS